MKRDYYLSFIVIFQMVAVVFQLLLPFFHIISTEQSATLRIAITLLTFLPGILILAKKRLKLLTITFFIYGMFLLFNYLLYPASHAFIDSKAAFTLTPISILSVLFIYIINNWNVFLKVLLLVSRIIPILGILFVWAIRYTTLVEGITYSMSFGYAILLSSLFLFNQEKTSDKVLAILLLLMIIILGSRGPVVVLLIYIIYTVLFSFKRKKVWQIPIALALVAGSILWTPKNSEVIEKSRTILLLESGEFISHDSGRDIIQKIIQQKILQKPLYGWGMGSDREFVDGYAHNIFLEIFVHYGLVVGGFLFLLFFKFVINLYTNQKLLDLQGGKDFFVAMFLFGFVPMIVSGSYLMNYNFAMFLGYLFRFVRIKKSIELKF